MRTRYPCASAARHRLTPGWIPCSHRIPLHTHSTWSQAVFERLWPRRDLTAADELEQGACGGLTPFPPACWGDRLEVYCLSRFLRLPRAVIVIWFEFFPTLGPGPSADIPTSNPGALFQPELRELLNPNLFFLECSCRSLLAMSRLQREQRLSKLTLPLWHGHTTPSQSQHVDLNSPWRSAHVHLPHAQADLEGTARG